MILLDYIPYITAIALGVVVSVCPCSAGANVTALTCMLRQSRTSYFSVVGSYLMARSVAYVLVGWLTYYMADQIELCDETLAVVGKVAGPLFIVIGLFLLDIFHIHGLENRCVLWMNKVFREKYSLWSAFLLGLLLAFAFCPYSAAIYFGSALPLAMEVSQGYLIPVLFALGAASPIAFIAWLFYKGVEERLNVWMKFQKFEYWFRKITAVIFILTGILFVIEYYFEG